MTLAFTYARNFLNEISTLVDLLQYRTLHQPEQIAFTFLKDGEIEELSLTYQALEGQARRISTLLRRSNATGERVLLLYPPGLEFIAAFFGCLYAGAIAVPAYPPRANQSMQRLQAIAADAKASFALTTASQLSALKQQIAHNPDLAAMHWLATDNLDSDLALDWQAPAIGKDTLAFLQYTSGSTGTPKGVMVSHGNLLHNLTLISQSFEVSPDSRGVIWLPQYHDMGLIGGVLQPLFGGFPVTLMSPVTFVQKPWCWLQAISRYQATISGGPNFAYDLCVRRITPEQRQSLDLSSWEVAFTGAEPIRAETLEQFARAFEPCGFRRSAFYPCYGMAEATLFITGGLKANPPLIHRVDAEALAQNQVLAPTEPQAKVRELVGCGHARSEQKVLIVNPETLTQCPDEQVGEIWVSSGSVAQGYWNKPEQTEQFFQAYLSDTREGPFLRTGDLGFLQDGELFFTGRLKDLIVIRGRNHYPQDIELTVEQSHPAIRKPGFTAAFSVEVDGEERLVVLAELDRRYRRHSTNKDSLEVEPSADAKSPQSSDVQAVIKSIRQAVAQQHELQVYGVLLLKTGSIPKTSSGKIQRHACKAAFLAGTLEVISSSIFGETGVSPNGTTDTPATSSATPQIRNQEGLVSGLRDRIAQILSIAPATLSLDQPLNELGLDSLRVVEIKNYVETNFGLILPIEAFLDDISIEKLASQIRSGVTLPTPSLQPSVAPILPKPSSRNDIGVFDRSAEPSPAIAKTGMQFSLFYFSSNEAEFTDDKYRLLTEGAKFADQNDFAAVWVPERHFHAFGGLYPNPSVLGAALAMVTKRVRIRAGSVVLPLQNPVRVAEEWSVVDNLSHGRVDLAFAAGWNPNDFTLAPENYSNRTQAMFSGMQTVQQLWRGESVALPNGVGKSAEIKIYPLPKQRNLSVWTTCSGGKERFIEAGAAGTNVLTALLFQSIEELAEKIALYREARAKHGHDPETGHVTLMLHTFVGEDLGTVRSKVREPFIEYLKTSVGLWRQGVDNLDDLTPKQQEDLLNYAFERYYQTSALFGTPDSCLEMVSRLKEIGVNEIACLIDFGVDVDSTMAGLYSLKKLKTLSNKADESSATNKLSGTVSHHYDAVSKLNQVYALDESFLTFGIFPEKVPNFSWISTFYNPQAYPEHAQLALESQLELRNILFGDIDFSAISKVLDFGCGHASDIIRLGKTHPHLQLTGYTISAKQAETDKQKIEQIQLQERVKVYNRDSAKDAFPDRYDLIFGFEVAVYVKQKQDLFFNIYSHLNEGGTVLLAEFISNTFSSIDHHETSSYIITAKEWIELFSRHQLKVVKCVEISQEVANFLYDPNFQENLAQLDPELVDAVVKAHFASWNNLGKLLDSKLASYALIVLQKDSSLSQEDLMAVNQNYLSSPTPYAAVQRSPLPIRQSIVSHQNGKVTFPENDLQALLNRQVSSSDETIPSAVVDLNAEAILDETIRPATPLTQPVIDPANIFLTGATGFLGAFLLYELLEQTPAQLHCLVRATNPERGMQRIRENLQSYGLWRDRFNDRIIAVIGDLSQPWLALTPDQFDALARQLDLIYHNAAYLNFVYPYAALKPTNVLGTQEVLRLACQGKTKPVHYISSTAVFDSAEYTSQVVTEQNKLDHPNGIAVGYAQSKWVAEKLVTIAGDRGLPVSIYRPAWIFGHSQTGVCNTDDFICRLIKGCIQMGAAPEMDYVWNISPVDYVSQATVHLSRQQNAIGKVFHLISPHPLHWNQLVDWMRSLSYSIDQLSYQEWQSKLKTLLPTEDNPLYPLIPLFLGHWTSDKLTIAQLYQQGRMPQLGCPETLQALAGSQLNCPPVNTDLLNTYFSYFIESGLLDAPSAPCNSQISLDNADLTPLISQKETSEPSEADSIATWLVSQVAQQLRVQPQDIDAREPLTCYGLDSVQAISVVSALEEWLGCELSPDLLNSYPTIEALSQYLATHTDKTTAPVNTSSAPIPDKQPNLLQKISAYLFWGFVKLLYHQWFQIRCCGLENIPQDRPYLVAANHTSHLDGQAIAVALAKKGDRISILAAKDYFFNRPLKSWFCKTFLHMIPLDRQGNFLEGMQECQQTLAHRKPVLIFPEGTRSLTGKMQRFQPGLGWLALQLNVPIVPVYIEGAYEALPKGKWLPRRHPIRIVVGKPLDVSPYKAKQGTVPDRVICQEIVDEVQAEIAQLRDNCTV